MANIFDDPSSGGSDQAVRCNFGGGLNVGSMPLSAINAAILGGPMTATHVNCGVNSIILMGDTDIIDTFNVLGVPMNSCLSTIANGQNNIAAGFNVNILNGCNNIGCGCYLNIGSGWQNNINTFCAPLFMDSIFAGIGNGTNNNACGCYIDIFNGDSNSINGFYSSIINGQCNSVANSFTTIAGGCCNTANGFCSFIGGGYKNFVEGNAAYLGAGSFNHIFPSVNSVLTGGTCNIIHQSDNSYIGGGYCNIIDPSLTGDICNSSIVGGANNCIQNDAIMSTIGSCSMIGGGECNWIQGPYAFIGGGCKNNILGDGTFSSIFSLIGGGFSNCIQGAYSFIGGGDTNYISQGRDNSILGGQGNQVTGILNAITGGGNNCIGNLLLTPAASASYSFIGGGNYNSVTGPSSGSNVQYASIAGGYFNLVTGDYGFIGGGCNSRNEGIYSSILGGDNNSLYAAWGAIAGGGYNVIASLSQYGFIGGGYNNTIDFSNNIFIGGGQYNIVYSPNSSILGGASNHIYADPSGGNSAILAGLGNIIGHNSCMGMIGGGWLNKIGDSPASSCSSIFGFIGGGSHNCIDVTGGVLGIGSGYGVIPGGQNNVICEGTCYSSILSGLNNCNNGCYSSILGGSGNCIPNGCSYVGIFGQNIGTIPACIQNNTFHVECLQACATPPWTPGLPKGTISYLFPAPPGFPVGSCVAMIS